MAILAIRPSLSLFRLRSSWSSSRYVQSLHCRAMSFRSYLVTPKELNAALKRNPPSKISTSPRVIPLCAAWFLPNDPKSRKGIDTFLEHHIPQARFFDIDAIADHESPYPHMLPTAEAFAQAMSNLGIRRDDEVVVYDTEQLGIFSAPRVGWTLRAFGHPNVHILDNYKLWIRDGFPTETGELAAVEKTSYPAPVLDSKLVISFGELKELAQGYGKEGAEKVEILDARPYDRWAGSEAEPRPGLASGHIPGSKSLPFQELLNSETMTFRSGPELRKIFETRGIDSSRPIICSCGSGVTATIIETALNEAEYGDPKSRRVYDGSWTEWAQRTKESEGLIKRKV